ncbi:MAG TPA: hypothetical protein VMD09_12825 [Solirubrobacteraceae bacterium]|nr:hypothetical protein [Solirubrobacteraceae bacterium]
MAPSLVTNPISSATRAPRSLAFYIPAPAVGATSFATGEDVDSVSLYSRAIERIQSPGETVSAAEVMAQLDNDGS